MRARDGYACTKCGVSNAAHLHLRGTQLDVHRVVPGSRYTVEGCVTLCEPCHAPEPRRNRGQRRREEPDRTVPVHLPPRWHKLLC